MANASQKSEVAANIAIIVVAVLVGAIAVKQYLLVPSQARPPQVKAGQSLTIHGVDWSQKPTHLVLALSNSCHFCSESAPFYQRLTRYAERRTDLQVMAILPQPVAEGTAYLRGLNVPIAEVRQVQFGGIPISGTPTIMLVDNQGKVRNVWIGKLAPDAEAVVMEQIGCKESCT